MAYLTNAEILDYAARATQTNFSAMEALIEKKAAHSSFDVFLSHSSKDEDRVLGIIEFLKQFGVNVYIDKLDDQLPRKTSPETGARLKRRIEECRKFVVLVSPNSKESKWIPWELGIGDVKKTLRNIALFPTVNENQCIDWPEQEYMGLYPRIALMKFAGFKEAQWIVYDHHKPSGILLKEWLSR